MGLWTNIVDWFGVTTERNSILRNFNKNACTAWDTGFPFYLKAISTKGDSSNKHTFSKWYSGFRIKATGNCIMNREACSSIALIILSNQTLVRQLIRCGYDTLEIHGESGNAYSAPLKELLLN
jgi:hypothetical protein